MAKDAKEEQERKLPPTALYLIARYQDWWKEEFNRTLKEPSQSGFARYLGVDRVSLNQWLNGTRVPDQEGMRAIAAVLGPGIYAAAGLKDIDEDLVRIADSWGTMSDERRAAILALLSQTDAGKSESE